MKRVIVKGFGLVQGVFFRKSSEDIAAALGISAKARNLEDGSIEIAVSGEALAVDKFIAWCHKGPPLARVDRVEIIEES